VSQSSRKQAKRGDKLKFKLFSSLLRIEEKIKGSEAGGYFKGYGNAWVILLELRRQILKRRMKMKWEFVLGDSRQLRELGVGRVCQISPVYLGSRCLSLQLEYAPKRTRELIAPTVEESGRPLRSCGANASAFPRLLSEKKILTRAKNDFLLSHYRKRLTILHKLDTLSDSFDP
jgi:hypothetical protein